MEEWIPTKEMSLWPSSLKQNKIMQKGFPVHSGKPFFKFKEYTLFTDDLNVNAEIIKTKKKKRLS